MIPKGIKLKKIDVLCLFLFLTIVKIHAVPQVIQQIMKIIFILTIFLYLLSKAPKSMNNIGMIIGGVFLFPSVVGIFNGNITIKIFLDGVLNSFVLFVTYSFIKYVSNRGWLKRVLDDFLYISTFACCISAFSMLSRGRATYVAGTKVEYFFGNKFSSIYILMFYIGLLYVKFYNDKKKKLEHREIFLICILVEIFVSYWVRCSTTMIGGFVLFLTIVFSGKRAEWLRKLISNPVAAVVYLTLPGMLALNIAVIMRIPQINHFVTGVLGKSAGLTGRAYIYSQVVEIFKGSPILGYGYNSDMVNRITEVGNAQNGLFQMLIEFGIIGVVVVCIITHRFFSLARNASSSWGFKVFIFTMCVCSVVEISFNYLFYLSLFIIGYSHCMESLIDSRLGELGRNRTTCNYTKRAIQR